MKMKLCIVNCDEYMDRSIYFSHVMYPSNSAFFICQLYTEHFSSSVYTIPQAIVMGKSFPACNASE